MKQVQPYHKHSPKKRFGQHFLTNLSVIDQIRSMIHPEPGDHMIEIGPGQGVLTAQLVDALARLDLIELDKDLSPLLQARFGQYEHVSLFMQDVLTLDFATLQENKELLRVVGNLPYNISTPIIFHVLKNINLVKDIIFLLQKEVAERIAASPGSKTYGKLSVMVQYYCKPQLLLTVGPEAFSPPPKVDSALLRLVPHETLPFKANDYQLFETLVTTAFQYRRKTIANALKEYIDTDLLQQVGIEKNARAENLSVKHFVDVANFLKNN